MRVYRLYSQSPLFDTLHSYTSWVSLSKLLNLYTPAVLICERMTSITEAVLRVESVSKSIKYHSEPVHRKSPRKWWLPFYRNLWNIYFDPWQMTSKSQWPVAICNFDEEQMESSS